MSVLGDITCMPVMVPVIELSVHLTHLQCTTEHVVGVVRNGNVCKYSEYKNVHMRFPNLTGLQFVTFHEMLWEGGLVAQWVALLPHTL